MSMSKKKKAKTVEAVKAVKAEPHAPACFACDGSGLRCNNCGESPNACGCEMDDTYDCPDCDGSGVSQPIKPSSSTNRRGE